MNDQAKNLRRKVNESNSSHDAKTISIVSGKGGVGKSNIALNFSLELITFNKKVLLFDLDVGMGNIDILLGLHARYSVVDMLTDQMPIHQIIEQGPNNLSYIAGGSGLTHIFTMDETKMDYFSKEYEQLAKHYDYIIFDLGAGSSEESIFFNLASDECMVVTTPEPTSITDAYSVIKQIVNNRRKMPIYMVINRCPSIKVGENTFVRFQQVITQFLHIDTVKMGILPEDRIVTQAVMNQTPYVLLNHRAPISKAMKQLTNNYIHQTDDPSVRKPVSFMDKLKQLLRER